MVTPAPELVIPEVDFAFADADEQRSRLVELAEDNWIARGSFAYLLFRYDDCQAILRDKRWHSAASLVTQLMGIDDERLMSRRESILSAEGDTHTRLRRLVAPSFSPRSADRLRPFMREVINGLIDAFAPTGRCDLVADF